jgi:DNA-binding CsgD family transcriptional regulator
MKVHVAVGQHWELSLNSFGARARIRIESIDAGTARAILVASGRPMSVSVRTLSVGNRGAKLLREAGGEAPYEAPSPPARVPRPAREKTASDYRRPLKGPRGVVRGGQLSVLQLKIEKLSMEGYGNAEIGKQIGISGESVAKHRDAIADARALETMRRMG